MDRSIDVGPKQGKRQGIRGVSGSCDRRGSSGLSWSWLDVVCLSIIGLAVLVAIWPFWQPGIASSVDMHMAIYRLFELDRSLQSGVLYPRLGLDWNFTYGTPLFEFYPPLVSYGALVFRLIGLGWVESSKAMFTLSLLLAAIGAYVYGRWLFRDRRAALVTALAYGLAPYLLTDVYERGAAAECLALALLPWSIWAAHHVLRVRVRGWIWLTAAMVALLMLSHNVTTLFALPLIAVYLGLLAWYERSWNRLPLLLLAVTLGLGLSAFYWIPALAERGYTLLEELLITDLARPDANLTSPAGLIQLSAAFDYWGDSLFSFALWQATAWIAAALALIWLPKDRRFNMALLVGMTILILMLQTDASRFFWQVVPLVRFIQFPWRLLGIASFCVALLAGSLFLLRPLVGWPGWLLAGGMCAVVVFGSLRNLSPQASPLWYPFASSQVGLVDLFEGARHGSALFDDFLPVWLTEGSRELATPRPAGSDKLPPLRVVPEVAVTAESPFRLRLHVSAESAFALRLHRSYYPGWQAYVDGRPAPTGPSPPLGLVTANLLAGDYCVLLQFEETALRRMSNAVSAVSLLVWVVGMASERRTRVALPILGIVLILLAGMTLRHLGGMPTPRQPVSSPANFEDQVQLLGYHLPKTTWRAGDTIPVRLYWLARRTPDDDYKVFIHLLRVPDGERVAQVDSEPILGFGPMTRWDPGELVVDEHLLPLDSSVPPGTYQIVTGLYRADTVQNLRVSGAGQVLPGDRLVLTEVAIGAEH